MYLPNVNYKQVKIVEKKTLRARLALIQPHVRQKKRNSFTLFFTICSLESIIYNNVEITNNKVSQFQQNLEYLTFAFLQNYIYFILSCILKKSESHNAKSTCKGQPSVSENNYHFSTMIHTWVNCYIDVRNKIILSTELKNKYLEMTFLRFSYKNLS